MGTHKRGWPITHSTGAGRFSTGYGLTMLEATAVIVHPSVAWDSDMPDHARSTGPWGSGLDMLLTPP